MSWSRTSVDAVVIGAGHNGLVAAIELADRGWDVVVCEATEHLGGAVRSSQFVAKGFESDMFSSFYPMAAASPVLNSLGLTNHGLTWVHAPTVLAHILPDDRVVTLSRDIESTVASVERFAPTDGRAWRELVNQWHDLEAPLLRLLFAPALSIRPALNLARLLGPTGAIRLARTAVLPARRFGSELFEGEGGPLLIAGNALHADVSPDAAFSAVFGWLLTMLGQSRGFPVPEGGSSALTNALVNRLGKAGGQVRTASRVEAVEVRHGRAVGVRTASGEYIAARKAVIADVPAPVLYGDLVGAQHLPTRFLRDLGHFEWDPPVLKINWALRSKVPWTNPEASQAGTVHLGVDMNGLTRYHGDLVTETYPRDPFVLMGQMTTADPSRSPAGTEAAWAYTHLPKRTSHSSEAIDEHVSRVEQAIDRHAPGFAETVLARVVQSPSQLEDENPSLVNGAINGGTAQMHQQLIFRPTIGLGGASTPIDALYLGGSSAHPGGGVHGAPGYNAARAALKRTGMLGAPKRAVERLVFSRLYERD